MTEGISFFFLYVCFWCFFSFAPRVGRTSRRGRDTGEKDLQSMITTVFLERTPVSWEAELRISIFDMAICLFICLFVRAP